MTPIKKRIFQLMIFFSISLLTSCTPLVKHTDPFYDLNGSEYPRGHIPLIKPIEVIRGMSSSSWNMNLINTLWIKLPKNKEQEVAAYYGYTDVVGLEKFALKDGVIIAYSTHVDQQADPYIRNNFYHWFVMVPSQNITKGFHTEDEFRQYIQTLGIQDPDWQTPDEAYDRFLDSGGCLDWIPDCK